MRISGELLERALHDKEKGMGSYRAEATDEALDFLADMAGGDARAALNAIELGILTTERSEDGLIHITLDVAQECIQRRAVKYDKTGDNLTIRFQRLSRVCEVPIRMRRFIIWRRCWMQARISNLLRGVS